MNNLWKSFSLASHSKWDDDRAWSSQEWKTDTETETGETRCNFLENDTKSSTWFLSRGNSSRRNRAIRRNEETLRGRSGRPDDINSREEVRLQQFVIGNDDAELELSVESRSFVNRVNDQVRNRQKGISNVTENEEKHSMIWRMFVAVTMESAVFMGKNYQNNFHSIVNTTGLTVKQMFDISTKLVTEQDEISGLETIGWENHSWKYLSLIGDERFINLQRTRVYLFSHSVLCLGKIIENPESNDAWEQRSG